MSERSRDTSLHPARPTDLEEALRRVEAISREVAAPRAEAVDREGQWPEPTFRAMQEAGLGGLVVPVEHGGSGFGLFALARACELLGTACASSAISCGMHWVGSAVLAAKTTPEQRRGYLEPICAGEHVTTLALSEPGTGSHFYLPETALLRVDDDRYRVDGTKTFVTNGGYADSYVLSVVSGGASAPVGDFSCVVVREGTPGMTWGGPWDGLGMRGNASRTLQLDGVEIAASGVLGRVGDELWYVFNVVAPHFLMAMSGTYLGVASAALAETCEHLKSRRYSRSGRSLAENPVLQHRLGELWGRLEGARRLVHHAALAADGGSEETAALLASKAAVADTAVGVVDECMTLMGGIAYREGSSMHRHLRDVRAAHVMAPTTAMLHTWVGRALLDQPLLSD